MKKCQILGEYKTVLILLLILISLAVSITEINVTAAESRTLVVPDDYPTIADAIGNASEGDTVFVKKGIHEGPINQTLVIDKTISLIGEDPEDTIIKLYPAYSEFWILTSSFFSYSDAITITANGFKLLDITIIIRNPGGYISATGNQIQIIGNNITTSPTTGVILNGSHCSIMNNVMGGRLQLNGAFNEIVRNSLYVFYLDGSSNIVKSNVCAFLDLGWFSKHADNNFILENKIASNILMTGIRLSSSNNNFLCKNYVSGYSDGLELSNSSENTIMANTIANSSTSIELLLSYNNTFYLNNFIDNGFNWNDTFYETDYIFDRYTDRSIRKANPNGTLSTSFWDNGIEGNYWDRYEGVDADGDGIGDSPYNIDVNGSIDNYPLMELFDVSNVEVEFPDWVYPILSHPPDIVISSPQNQTYTTNSVNLAFTADEAILWMGYSLDGQNKVTVTENTLELKGLSTGLHSIRVYANDAYGNMGVSETVYFTVEPPFQMWIIIGLATVTIVIAAAIYATKPRKTTSKHRTD